ncbi:hypothetical protein DVH24_014836 [Malus domestica]|uniref:RNase H type-1 domain-containing protein n=1 Tax=Malus domestica TaxID=3750 RepID=A0A498K272_MALDO|nr:hypothetical protein DVH24_014836 [Malus domestica]
MEHRDGRVLGAGGMGADGVEGEQFQWTKPSFGVLKLNCDATWKKKTNVGGVGWVLHNFTGLPKFVGGVGGERFATAIMADEEAIR